MRNARKRLDRIAERLPARPAADPMQKLIAGLTEYGETGDRTAFAAAIVEYAEAEGRDPFSVLDSLEALGAKAEAAEVNS